MSDKHKLTKQEYAIMMRDKPQRDRQKAVQKLIPVVMKQFGATKKQLEDIAKLLQDNNTSSDS